MAFFEVRKEILQQNHTELVMRFLMDPQSNTTLHIWSDSAGRILRYQAANPKVFLEWKADYGFLSGTVDEGDHHGIGYKASPLLNPNLPGNRDLVLAYKTIFESSLHPENGSRGATVELLRSLLLEIDAFLQKSDEEATGF